MGGGGECGKMGRLKNDVDVRTCLVSVTHVKDVAGVYVVVERVLNQLLRLVACQLRYSTQTHTAYDGSYTLK